MMNLHRSTKSKPESAAGYTRGRGRQCRSPGWRPACQTSVWGHTWRARSRGAAPSAALWSVTSAVPRWTWMHHWNCWGVFFYNAVHLHLYTHDMTVNIRIKQWQVFNLFKGILIYYWFSLLIKWCTAHSNLLLPIKGKPVIFQFLTISFIWAIMLQTLH